MDVSDAKFFLVLVVIFTLVVIFFSIANLVYYRRVLNYGKITRDEAQSLIIINSISIVITIAVLIWALYIYFDGASALVQPDVPTSYSTPLADFTTVKPKNIYSLQ
jgi:hypothetical protein